MDTIFQLNNQLRYKAKPTDVISLPDEPYKGSIFICPEYIKEQGHTTSRIIHLFVHSILHIAGYDHDTDSAFNKMSQIESKILTQLKHEDPYV